MPSYLSSTYPSSPNLLSRYGIVVGVVGSVAVLLGGFSCSSNPRVPTMALYVTAIGGMLSSAFVICMVSHAACQAADRKQVYAYCTAQ